MGALAGFFAKMAIGASGSFGEDKPLDFISESIDCNEEIIDRAGIRGTREHPVEVLRTGLRKPGGQITMEPTALEWSYLLPWILGADASGTSYALAETIQSRYLAIKRSDGTDGKDFEYSGCVVNRATISCEQGGLLKCSLDVAGVEETVANTGSFPSLTVDITTGPFTFSDSSGAITIGGTAYAPKRMSIVVDNKVDTERFHNSNTRTALVAMDRDITVDLELGYGDAEAVYNAGSSGLATAMTFTNGGTSILFSFVKLVFPRKSPTVGGKHEVMLPVRGRAHKSGSTASLAVTLDSTP